MAVTINIADVVDDIQFRLHLPAFASTGFVTPAALLKLLQRSAGRLGALHTKLFQDNYFARTSLLNTQAELDLVSLPAGMTTLTSIHWLDGDRETLLERAHDTEYAQKPQSWTSAPLPWGWDAGRRSRYVLEGGAIRLTPPPAGIYTLRVAYQTALTIASLSDTIQAQDQSWADWLALDACIIIRSREDKDASNFVTLKGDIEADMRDQAANRDRNGVTQVRDVEGYNEVGNGRWPYRGF